MIKNYTSSVPVSRSVQHIEDCLIRHGARNIMKMYDREKRLESICFIISIDGKEYPFKLPTNVAQAEVILRSRIKRLTPETDKRVREQAERTAWKIESDWVDAQMAKIELQQIEILQVFLAYVYNPATERTFFEVVKGNGFKALMLTEKT